MRKTKAIISPVCLRDMHLPNALVNTSGWKGGARQLRKKSKQVKNFWSKQVIHIGCRTWLESRHSSLSNHANFMHKYTCYIGAQTCCREAMSSGANKKGKKSTTLITLIFLKLFLTAKMSKKKYFRKVFIARSYTLTSTIKEVTNKGYISRTR